MPEGRPRREPADPLQMSLAEKLACEWEARHDVAARRRIASAAPVQDYLTHARCEDTLHAVQQSPQHHPHAGAEQSGGAVPAGLRGWLRWGEDDGSSSGSMLPRGC
jgi:hypothetical protein